jgi:hypothetical protein
MLIGGYESNRAVPSKCTTRAVPLNAVKVGVLNGHHTCGDRQLCSSKVRNHNL